MSKRESPGKNRRAGVNGHTERIGISVDSPMLSEAQYIRNGRRTSLAKIAAAAERQAAKNPVAKSFLDARKAIDDYCRASSICSECGGKALYYMVGKMYCKQHIHIGQTAYRKKWTPQAKEKKR